MSNSPIRLTIWNEGRHEKQEQRVRDVYPEGIHTALAQAFKGESDVIVTTTTMDDPEQGMPDTLLESTDVLIWWAHISHKEISDTLVDKIQQRVLSGMGFIALHSAHMAKPFRRLMGTNCTLRWREANEKERVWNVAPGHEITRGIGQFIDVPHTEMYGERFDIPEPDKLIFISWYEGGDVFRSGCTWDRGNGRVFYFSPGHETFPIYYDPLVQKVMINAVRWASPKISMSTAPCPSVTALETIRS